jgi:hypothetical protein
MPALKGAVFVASIDEGVEPFLFARLASVVGTRSAVYAPVELVGAVWVVEVEEPQFYVIYH